MEFSPFLVIFIVSSDDNIFLEFRLEHPTKGGFTDNCKEATCRAKNAKVYK